MTFQLMTATKHTLSDGDLPECYFPPREVLTILKGFNKSRRRLTRCRQDLKFIAVFVCLNIFLFGVAADLWCINRLGLGCIVVSLVASINKSYYVLLLVWYHQTTGQLENQRGKHVL
ncbi:hypothetical protein CFC21_052547 [Triticum aestivum]|uniref:Uncharacterized protein n=3 Tax=Triticum TaxID=4564 RepID=A0A9R0SA97_TRITD|nr:hypothetical protein CFC21_052547 [Triticum aestivum]VAH91596.1 unnamed protein product [Triticum turgidum subsp. durum]